VASNPFSTRFIRPGAIPFLFAGGELAASLVERLHDQHWWGQIIGPHGSGKSTLLETLKTELEAADRQIVAITLHQGEHRLPPWARSSLTATTQLVIDGYEQLSWWSRWWVKLLCQRRGAGLLITAHTDAGLPTMYCTEPSQELARAVVAQLLGAENGLISSRDIVAAYQATGGNMREMLFRLYDIYQANESIRNVPTDVSP
jgi:hypothetical protein